MSDDKTWSTMEDNVDIVTYTWKANVSSLQNGKDIISDIFKDVGNAFEFILSVCAYRRGFNTHRSGFIISLYPISKFRRRYMFKIYIPEMGLQVESNTYTVPHSGKIHIDSILTGLECLKIYCTVIMEKAMKVSNCKLIDDLGALVNAEKFSDVTIETAGGHKIPAHKIILSARSNVFAAMFNHDMMENQMNCVKIEDVNQEVVMEMLGYMYTGNAPKLKDLAEDLLVAADKYGLDELKKMCLKSLNDNITIENVARVFKLADVYEETELVLKCVQFIKQHAESVAKTPNWKILLESDKDLIIKEFVEPKTLIAKDDEDLKVAKKRKLQ